MGNNISSRPTNQRWFLDSMEQQNFHSLNKMRTQKKGQKPLLVVVAPDQQAWQVVPGPVQVQQGARDLRVVRQAECLSFATLLQEYGHCLVTYAETPIQRNRLALTGGNGVKFHDILTYLGLALVSEKNQMLEISELGEQRAMRNHPTISVDSSTLGQYGCYRLQFWNTAGASNQLQAAGNAKTNARAAAMTRPNIKSTTGVDPWDHDKHIAIHNHNSAAYTGAAVGSLISGVQQMNSAIGMMKTMNKFKPQLDLLKSSQKWAVV